MIWDWEYAYRVLPDLLSASVMTLTATFGGYAIACGLGLVLALLCRTNIAVVEIPTRIFIEFIRSTPLLIQLFALYYILPLWGVTLPALVCGMLALGVHYATYCAEVYRAGIESVPKGQFEAAKVIGLSASDTYRRVVLPQAIPPIILPLGNYFVSMLKETPLLLAITIVEVVAAARIIGSETFRYTEPMTIAGIIFLIYSLLFSYAARGIDFAVKRKWY